MIIDMPPERTGNLQTDFDRLWDWAFKTAESLRVEREGTRNELAET